MYNYFKSVLSIAKDKHRKALKGKSSAQKKLQRELLEITYKIQECFRDKSLTEEQYKELIREFGRISFINLADQRNGKLSL